LLGGTLFLSFFFPAEALKMGKELYI
jgi:hypothetical protein